MNTQTQIDIIQGRINKYELTKKIARKHELPMIQGNIQGLKQAISILEGKY